MWNTMRVFGFACFAFVLSPVLAVNPGLQVTATGWSGQSVTVAIHNASANAVSGRVRVTLQLDDETLDTLTSGDITVPGGATISIALSASRPVSGIEDNPEPIGFE
jgi:hypothetical protein